MCVRAHVVSVLWLHSCVCISPCFSVISTLKKQGQFVVLTGIRPGLNSEVWVLGKTPFRSLTEDTVENSSPSISVVEHTLSCYVKNSLDSEVAVQNTDRGCTFC